MAWLAEAQLQIGDPEAADSSLAKAFEIIKETGESSGEPEVHRVSAEAILRKPGKDMPQRNGGSRKPLSWRGSRAANGGSLGRPSA
jgi:hypothetical protein